MCGDSIAKLNSNFSNSVGASDYKVRRVGLAKLPIGVLTTLLFGQLSHPRAGGPIKQLGLGAKLHNYQSSSVAQNYHCDSLKTCFSNCKAALASALVSAPCSHICR